MKVIKSLVLSVMLLSFASSMTAGTFRGFFFGMLPSYFARSFGKSYVRNNESAEKAKSNCQASMQHYKSALDAQRKILKQNARKQINLNKNARKQIKLNDIEERLKTSIKNIATPTQTRKSILAKIFDTMLPAISFASVAIATDRLETLNTQRAAWLVAALAIPAAGFAAYKAYTYNNAQDIERANKEKKLYNTATEKIEMLNNTRTN